MNSKYKLTKNDLDIGVDRDFIDSVLEFNKVVAEPETRPYLLDLAYTLARNQLVEARRFANLKDKINIDEEDLRVAKLEPTDDFQNGPLQLTKSLIQPISAPLSSTSLLLPPWRSCQVGATADLKQLPIPPESAKPVVKGAPLNKPPRPRLPLVLPKKTN